MPVSLAFSSSFPNTPFTGVCLDDACTSSLMPVARFEIVSMLPNVFGDVRHVWAICVSLLILILHLQM